MLRCLGGQHLYEYPWLERSIDAVALGSGALLFTQDKTSGVQQRLPDLPMARPLGALARQRLRGFVTKRRSSGERFVIFFPETA